MHPSFNSMSSLSASSALIPKSVTDLLAPFQQPELSPLLPRALLSFSLAVHSHPGLLLSTQELEVPLETCTWGYFSVFFLVFNIIYFIYVCVCLHICLCTTCIVNRRLWAGIKPGFSRKTVSALNQAIPPAPWGRFPTSKFSRDFPLYLG